jgi:hypothetical protein
MGKYEKGDHVKIEVGNEGFGESEWMWVFVESSDDQQELVFGKLDSQPVVFPEMKLGQELAVSYGNIKDRRRFS